MKREDIRRMAREAGWTDYSLLHSVEVWRLEQFANLVAAAERVETERLMVGQALIREIDARHQARIDERERCAKICDNLAASETDNNWEAAYEECAAAIRARGEE